jgi:hypothetical protein
MKNSLLSLLCAALAMADLAVAAPSLILSSQPGWNGWAVEARCRAGFREHGGAGEAMTPYDTRSGTVLQNLAAGAFVTIPTAAAAMLPGSGAAKDKAQGSLAFRYTVGTAASDDTFSFTIDSTTSAVAAKHNFGAGLVPADAVFECELKLRTYAPLAAGPAVRIPAMPVLTSPATETMAATFSFAPGGLSGFRVPGDPELTFPLTLATGQWFEYTLTYSIVTPYGSDPHVSYTLLGGAAGQAPANLVPNPEFEIVGPNGATVVTNIPNVLNPSAAAAWNQALFNGTQLTTSLVPSTDVLAGSCGNMLRIESNGQFTGSNASPISVNLPFEIPVGSRGSLDIRVLAGSVTIAFAINTANATTLDSAVTVSSANPNWQHVTFTNATLPTGQIQLQVAAPPGESAIVFLDNVCVRMPLVPRSTRYDHSAGFGNIAKWISDFAYPNQIPAAGDFDGDGLDDIVTFLRSAYPAQDGDVYVARNTGSSFVFAGLWQSYFCVGSEIPAVGDFDGDGRDDVVTFVPSSGKVWVALSTGYSFCTGREWYDTSGGWPFFYPGEIPLVGDFNGDGRDDIAVCTRGATADAYVALSTGRGFARQTLWHGDFCAGTAVPKAGDVNGDGKADLVCFVRDSRVDGTKQNVEVATSTGTAFQYGTPRYWNFNFAPTTAYEPLLADLNGDGSMDIAAVHNDGRVFAAIKATGAASFGSGTGGTNTGDPNWLWKSGVRNNANETPLIGHFNRDMNDDLCVFVFGERTSADFAATYVTLGGDPTGPLLTSLAAPANARAGDPLQVTGSLAVAGWQTRARLVGPNNTILTPTVAAFSSTGGTLRVPSGCYPSGLYRFLIFDDTTQEPSSNSFPVQLVGTEDAWRVDHFSAWERSTAAVSGDNADPDRDGLPNLAEYIFGTNPRTPQFNYLPWNRVGTNQLVTQFSTRSDRGCVKITIQHSGNLATWANGDSFTFDGTGPMGGTVLGYLATPATTEPRRFARLSFSRL